MNKVTTEQIRGAMASHEFTSDWQLFQLLLDIVDNQQEQIDNLHQAAVETQKRLRERTDQFNDLLHEVRLEVAEYKHQADNMLLELRLHKERYENREKIVANRIDRLSGVHGA